MSERNGKMLKITLVKSPIGYSSRQKETVKSLGLHRMSQSVLIGDAPQIRGMIAKVSHLVEVEEVEAK
jgi:large subunit ribosomal protein L30